MSKARFPIEQVDPPRSPKETLPTMYDLPSEDPEEAGLPDEYHLWQCELCSATFCPPTYSPDQVFVASDLNLYYDSQHTGWYKRPDWFAVVGGSRFYAGEELRLSYVIWQEEIRPIVAIELLSPSTRNEDLGLSKRKGKQPTKWEVYEQVLGIPYYVVFDGNTDELHGFELEGDRYLKMELPENKVWIPSVELGLGLWQGEYRGKKRQWLRWYDAQGNWIPTIAEKERHEKQLAQARAELAQAKAQKEQQEKELAQATAELAQARAERLAERLRQAGIDPEQV